jgi:glycosyltransferase involved in cell wall biosynthesis
MRFSFLTATPLNVIEGSGTFAGIATLARALRRLDVEVEIVAPGIKLPGYTMRRLWFNEQLRNRSWGRTDVIVGFDMDGYRIAGSTGLPHVAAIKGIIADEMRFERGVTRLSMSIQARCERAHVRRADLVIATSRYAAGRIQELYGVSTEPAIVPESINLAAWRELFARNPAEPDPEQFTMLCVCRFYPRKRLELLLGAASRLRGLQFRIVGDGPERERLRAICREKELDETVHWLGNLSQDELAREYNRCDVFCLPSVQEGFGIVFLEAMAAGKPIVAARAGAVPEVVEQGLLVEPESEEALADGIRRLHADADLRASLAAAGTSIVQRYDAPKVAALFLAAVEPLLEGTRT